LRFNESYKRESEIKTMVEKEVEIVPEEGLHARPAAQFVKTAKGYSSEIKVVKDGKEANAKSSLSLMSLGAAQGDKLLIQAQGEDEEAAADALAKLITEAEH
jgi:phosphocarrier protein HPr